MADQSTVQRRTLEPNVVSQHEVLRPAECEAVRDQVLALKRHWRPRSNEGNFFTLGVASYLDAVGRHGAYVGEARETNRILRENFDWLCERVRTGFEKLLGQSVRYSEQCALPGFHIFFYGGGDHSGDRPSGRAHFDLQWIHAMPGRRRPDETLSFTLPIDEPSGGCSLAVWPAHFDAIKPDFDALAHAANTPAQTVRYARGRMVVHDGLLLHAIGAASIADPKGYRITFQGHGAKLSGNWQLYW
jgi:hypothetical protein